MCVCGREGTTEKGGGLFFMRRNSGLLGENEMGEIFFVDAMKERQCIADFYKGERALEEAMKQRGMVSRLGLREEVISLMIVRGIQ